MKKLTAEWVKKAEADFVIARQSSQSEIPLHDGRYSRYHHFVFAPTVVFPVVAVFHS
jgi:hypothetical protein